MNDKKDNNVTKRQMGTSLQDAPAQVANQQNSTETKSMESSTGNTGPLKGGGTITTNTNPGSVHKTTVPVRRTYLDILRFIMKESFGQDAWEAFGREGFLRDVLPLLRSNPRLSQEISESEYQAAIQQIRPELPYFVRWLLEQRF
jgi:hypothetical protein